MDSWQTLKRLEEKITSISNQDSQEAVNDKIDLFFDEVLLRRRDDPYEGGLQASGVINKDAAAFKINERDGIASHAHTQETLAQFLRGDKFFSSEESMRMWDKKMNSRVAAFNIPNFGFAVRYLVGADSLVIIFETKLAFFSSFQLDVIQSCLNRVKKELDKGSFIYVTVNFSTKNDKILSEREFSVMEAIEKIETITRGEKSSSLR